LSVGDAWSRCEGVSLSAYFIQEMFAWRTMEWLDIYPFKQNMETT
jgi:hypothetical protein